MAHSTVPDNILPVGGHISLQALLNNGSPFLIHQIMPMTLPTVYQRHQLKQRLEQSGKNLVIHAPYTINLAHSPDSSQGRKGREILQDQVHLASEVAPTGKLVQVVFHVGKSCQIPVATAQQHFYQNLQTVLSTVPENVQLLLETAAGQGTELFVSLDEIFAVYEAFKVYPTFGLCVDSCHIFSAGHTIESFLARPEVINASATATNPVKLIHLNDSETPFNSHVDRHANLGIGSIFRPGTQTLENLVKWSAKAGVPMVLETDRALHQEEVKMVYDILYPGKQVYFDLIAKHTSNLGITTNISTSAHDMIMETGVVSPTHHTQSVNGDLISEDSPHDKKMTPLPNKSITNTSQSIMSQNEGAKSDVVLGDGAMSLTINEKIVHILSILADTADDRFRKKALKEGAETVRSLPFIITAPEQVKGMKGIGKGSIYNRIFEIFQTGTLTEYETKREELETLDQLGKVQGIGPKTAHKLYHENGVRGIDHLVSLVEQGRIKLTSAQMSGLKHFWDIRQRIPRSEIIQFDTYLKDLLAQVDPRAKHLIVGSYRRGRPDSGDIDVMFTHPDLVTVDQTRAANLLDQLLVLMQSVGAIDSVLSHGKSKILLIAHLPQTVTGNPKPISRRVDFLLTPLESAAAASLYFTGSKYFNVVTRHRALNLGFRLNEYGLYTDSGVLIPTDSEEEILGVIGVRYYQPTQREEAFLKGQQIYQEPISVEKCSASKEGEGSRVAQLMELGLEALEVMVSSDNTNPKRTEYLERMKVLLPDLDPRGRYRLVKRALLNLKSGQIVD